MYGSSHDCASRGPEFSAPEACGLSSWAGRSGRELSNTDGCEKMAIQAKINAVIVANQEDKSEMVLVSIPEIAERRTRLRQLVHLQTTKH